MCTYNVRMSVRPARSLPWFFGSVSGPELKPNNLSNLDTIEAVEMGEIASIHALFMHVAEKIAGCSKR